MTDKPKRKNLSPEELLQQANLLYRDNEAFVRGKSKVIASTAEMFDNLSDKYGLQLSHEGFPPNKWEVSGCYFISGVILLLFAIFVCDIMFSLLVADFNDGTFMAAVLMACITLPLAVLGMISVLAARKTAKFNEQEFRTEVSDLMKWGHLILGHIETRKQVKGYSIIEYSYVSPETGDIKKGSWRTKKYQSLFAKRGNLILLCLNDDCVIVL
jgi:hypothetical protein